MFDREWEGKLSDQLTTSRNAIKSTTLNGSHHQSPIVAHFVIFARLSYVFLNHKGPLWCVPSKEVLLVTDYSCLIVRLGNSGLKVSKIILGCMSYGSPEWQGWILPEEEAIKHIKFAFVSSI